MKNIVLALLVSAILAACTTTATTQPAPQTYRLKGSEKTLNITGDGSVSVKNGLLSSQASGKISIFFNGVLQIQGNLDKTLNGEFAGSPYEGKPTAASCTSKFINADVVEIRCMVFVDNERTVTLTF